MRAIELKFSRKKRSPPPDLVLWRPLFASDQGFLRTVHVDKRTVHDEAPLKESLCSQTPASNLQPKPPTERFGAASLPRGPGSPCGRRRRAPCCSSACGPEAAASPDVLYYCHTVPYRTLPYRTAPYRTVPYSTALY